MAQICNFTDAARHDAEIAQNIRQALRFDNDVPDEQIVVAVIDGLATLEGVVATELQKEVAEAVARKVKGVREVINRIGLQAALAG